MVSKLIYLALMLVWGSVHSRDITYNLPEEQDVYDDIPIVLDNISKNSQECSTACFIDVNGGLPEPQPLLIRPGTNQFMHPDTRDGILRLYKGDTVELYCSASFVAPFTSTRNLLASCVSNDQFLVNGQEVTFSALRCTGNVARTARRSPQQTCLQNATEIQLGYNVNGNRFFSIMDICHDEVLQSTHYARNYLSPPNLGFQRNLARPGFILGGFFPGTNVDQLYTGNVQRETIGRILGQSRVDELFDNPRNLFLARGHLAARADFIYWSEQRATFYFVNAAPQWQSFNAGNWERIEAGLKSFIATNYITAEIYTGTFGILELPDVNGINRELYLSVDANNVGRIPVPKYFYKIVIRERVRSGIVFIGLNNPHVSAEEVASGRYNLCKDVGDQVSYVNWQRNNLHQGFVYACDVNEFAKVVKHLPSSVYSTALLV